LIIIIDGFDLWLIGQTMSRHHFYYYIKWTGRKITKNYVFFFINKKGNKFPLDFLYIYKSILIYLTIYNLFITIVPYIKNVIYIFLTIKFWTFLSWSWIPKTKFSWFISSLIFYLYIIYFRKVKASRQGPRPEFGPPRHLTEFLFYRINQYFFLKIHYI
jgi:hypothetical protein